MIYKKINYPLSIRIITFVAILTLISLFINFILVIVMKINDLITPNYVNEIYKSSFTNIQNTTLTINYRNLKYYYHVSYLKIMNATLIMQIIVQFFSYICLYHLYKYTKLTLINLQEDRDFTFKKKVINLIGIIIIITGQSYFGYALSFYIDFKNLVNITNGLESYQGIYYRILIIKLIDLICCLSNIILLLYFTYICNSSNVPTQDSLQKSMIQDPLNDQSLHYNPLKQFNQKLRFMRRSNNKSFVERQTCQLNMKQIHKDNDIMEKKTIQNAINYKILLNNEKQLVHLYQTCNIYHNWQMQIENYNKRQKVTIQRSKISFNFLQQAEDILLEKQSNYQRIKSKYDNNLSDNATIKYFIQNLKLESPNANYKSQAFAEWDNSSPTKFQKQIQNKFNYKYSKKITTPPPLGYKYSKNIGQNTLQKNQDTKSRNMVLRKPLNSAKYSKNNSQEFSNIISLQSRFHNKIQRFNNLEQVQQSEREYKNSKDLNKNDEMLKFKKNLNIKKINEVNNKLNISQQITFEYDIKKTLNNKPLVEPFLQKNKQKSQGLKQQESFIFSDQQQSEA